MDNKTKIGALLLASSLGAAVGRIGAAPAVPSIRVVGAVFEPAVSIAVLVGGKPARIQCTDASGPVTKLAGEPFPEASSLCEATRQYAAGAKASVGLIAADLRDALE